MKVLIGVDPHKASLAVAAVDEASGELLERASFPQDRVGLRALERWARRFPERRWAVENAGGLGRHLAVRLATSGESVVDVPPKLSARVRVLSSGNARKTDEVDAESLARLARVDSKLLYPLKHRGEDSQAHLALIRSRETLVGTRTQLINHVRGAVKSFGARCPSALPKASTRWRPSTYRRRSGRPLSLSWRR
jgi:transposase